MKKSLVALLAIAALLTVAGCGLRQNKSSDSGSEGNESPSAKETYTLEVDGKEREFIVYRPATLAEDEEVPVVFMFHGSGGTGEKFYEISGWTEQADEEGFMVIFPTALKYHVFSEEKVVKGEVQYDVAVYQTKWNGYDLEAMLDPEYPDQTLYDDVKFVQEMVDFVNENYAADETRFYATGFSNGANFTARLTIEMSDAFAAFAPAGAGRIKDEIIAENVTESFLPRPVMQMVGELDLKLTHSAGVEAFTMDESAAEEGDIMRDYVIDPYLSLLGLEDAYEYKRTDRVSAFRFAQPVEEGTTLSEYDLLIVEGMGHVYPNETNYPISAAEIFWTFFEPFSL